MRCTELARAQKSARKFISHAHKTIHHKPRRRRKRHAAKPRARNTAAPQPKPARTPALQISRKSAGARCYPSSIEQIARAAASSSSPSAMTAHRNAPIQIQRENADQRIQLHPAASAIEGNLRAIALGALGEPGGKLRRDAVLRLKHRIQPDHDVLLSKAQPRRPQRPRAFSP